MTVTSSAAASPDGGSDPEASDDSAASLKDETSAGFLDEPIAARAPVAPSPELINEDLAPVLVAARTFSTYDIAALWVGLVVGEREKGRGGGEMSLALKTDTVVLLTRRLFVRCITRV